MLSLNLVKTNPSKINLLTLQKEPKGSIAIILDENGKLQGVDQEGNLVAVVVVPPAPAAPAAPAPVVSPKMEESIITKVGDKINDGLSKLLDDQGKEFKKELEAASKVFTSQLSQLQDAHKKTRDEDSKSFTAELKKIQDEVKKLTSKPKTKPKK